MHIIEYLLLIVSTTPTACSELAIGLAAKHTDGQGVYWLVALTEDLSLPGRFYCIGT